VQRQSDVAREPDRIPVGLIDRHPGELAGILRRPLAEHRRLAVSGRPGQQDQRGRVRSRGENVQQLGARDQPIPVYRSLDLRLDSSEGKL
jgi:hypothetical protein